MSVVQLEASFANFERKREQACETSWKENQTSCEQEHFRRENIRILMRVDMVLQYELYSEIHRHFFVTGLLNLWMLQAVHGSLNWRRKGGNVHAILLIEVREK